MKGFKTKINQDPEVEGSKTELPVNPLTPHELLGRNSPHNINTISSRRLMRTKKISIRGFLVDPIPNSLN